jgi:hypothetical protein
MFIVQLQDAQVKWFAILKGHCGRFHLTAPSSTLTTVHDHKTPKVDLEKEGDVGLIIRADMEIHLQLWVISAGQIT